MDVPQAFEEIAVFKRTKKCFLCNGDFRRKACIFCTAVNLLKSQAPIEKKRSEGKSGKLAMVAGLNKFLRVYYGKVTELYRSLPAIE